MSKKNKGPKPGPAPKGGLPKFNFSWIYINGKRINFWMRKLVPILRHYI